ncbi:MAG: FMN-binding protein [Clostridia bacterium]|nr:FMN-binding protein [Clostridia bacterium]
MKRNKAPDIKTENALNIPYVKIILCLFLICTICAGLLGTTYILTRDTILENEKATVQKLLISIYGDDAVFESDVTVPEGQKAEAVYLAKNPDASLRGYAIRVLSPGFSDDIDMIVGFNADGTIRKIEIIALSETAGLGTKVAESNYLAQYVGKSDKLALKTDIDAISGATKSSRAVLNGVNLATECLKALGA